MRTISGCLGLILAAAILVPSARAAPPEPSIWRHWTMHNPGSQREIDHSPWNRWLSRYVKVNGSGLVLIGYDKVRRSDRFLLDSYIDDLEGHKISRYKRKEQLAYWINLYNALSVKVVLSLLPIDSVRHLVESNEAVVVGPWRTKVATVEGKGLSLDDIEHRILRPIWNDPRVLYALNRAAVSSPGPPPEAVTAQNLDSVLDRLAGSYVNSTQAMELSDGRLTVSSFYTWYRPDFGGDDLAVIDHLKLYAEPELRDRLEQVTGIAEERYDWRLNSHAVVVEVSREMTIEDESKNSGR